MKRHLVRRGGLLAAVVASIALAGAVPASAAPGDGSAYGVNVDVTLLGHPAVHLGPLAAANTNGPTESTAVSANVPGVLTTGVIKTSAVRDDNSGAVTAKASVADVGLPLLKPLGNVGAKAVEAVCTATQEGVKGSTTLVGANLGSLGKVDATPAANTALKVQVGALHVATLILNEQIKNKDGSLTVNALHLKLLGGDALGALGSGDVILSSATCGPAAPPMPLASGAGMWIGFGVVAAIAVPVGLRFSRRRSAA